MSDKKMWFGNRNYMQWVPCPQSGATYGLSGSQQGSSYLSGGQFVRNSVNKAKTFNFSWSLTERDNIRSITDYVEGVYGKGAIYWVDPFTMDKNALAQSFATPSIGGYDGPILAGEERPELVATPVNGLGYPTQSARYDISAGAYTKKHWIPIPPGHTAWVGAHGVPESTLGLRVQPTNGMTPVGAPVDLDVEPVTSTARVTMGFPADTPNAGIEVSLATPDAGSGYITLSGVIVQILKSGVTPEPGGFISGQGHSGCDWQTLPSREAYSAAMDLVGLSAQLVETEQWA